VQTFDAPYGFAVLMAAFPGFPLRPSSRSVSALAGAIMFSMPIMFSTKRYALVLRAAKTIATADESIRVRMFRKYHEPIV